MELEQKILALEKEAKKMRFENKQKKNTYYMHRAVKIK